MMNRLLFYSAVLMAVSCLAEPKVSVGVESRDACVGQSFVYQIKLSDTEEQPNIRLPEIAGCRIQMLPPSRNQSTRVSIVNGRVQREVKNETLYSFRLTPLKEGELVIPSISFKLGRKSYSTEGVSVQVSREEQITDIALELSFERPICYVGQPTRAIWRLYLGRKATLVGFDLPLLNRNEFNYPNDLPKTSDDKEYVRVPLGDGRMTIGVLSMVDWKGAHVRCLEFSCPVEPTKAGVYELEAGSVTCQVEDKKARRPSRDPFLDSLFDRTPMKEVTLDGNRVTLEVKELPPAPAGFSGLLGPCQITASATPLEVNVGDPIVLTVTVAGMEFPEQVKLSPINQQSSLKKEFRVSSEEPGAVRENTKVYQCTLRARTDKVKEIPALEYVYFDSEAGEYRTYRTQPIPLKVNEVHQVTVADVQGTGSLPIASKESVKALDDGLAHNYSYKRGLGKENTHGISAYTIVLTVLGVLFVVQLVIKWVRWLRTQNPEKRRRSQDLETAKQQIAQATGNQELYNGFQLFLRTLLELKPGEVSSEVVAEAMKAQNMSEERVTSVLQLLKRFEEIQYAGGESHEDLKQNTTQILQQLERNS